MNDRTLLEMIRKIIYKETIYLRHYYAKVISTTDPINEGRIRVACDQLGMNRGQEIMASPRGQSGITTPAVNDFVEIYFMNGDRDRCVYLGQVLDFENMLPKNYDGQATTHVIFEDNANKIHAKFDESQNILEIGNSDMQFVGRIGDEIKSTSAEDTALWNFINAIAVHVHPSNGAPSPTLAVAPTSLTGKITKGSDQVKVGKK